MQAVIKNINYDLNQTLKVASVIAKTDKYSGNVVIPTTIPYGDVVYQVTSIGYHAFEDCTDLVRVSIPDSVCKIDESAFINCPHLLYYSHGDCLYLGNTDNPFLWFMTAKNADITEVKVHPNTKFIFKFGRCKNVKSISISKNVVDIDREAFETCSELQSIVVDSGNTIYKSVDGVLYKGNELLHCPRKKDGILEVIHGTERILENAIGGVVYIEYKRDDDVEGMLIDMGIDGEYRGCGCENITEIQLPNSLKEIGQYAFAGCTALQKINIPPSVEGISSEIFKGCTVLKNIICAGVSCDINSNNSFNGVKIPVYNDTVFFYMPRENKGTYSIPDGITVVKAGAFGTYTTDDYDDLWTEGCGLTEIMLPDSVSKIEQDAFLGVRCIQPIYNSAIFVYLPRDWKGMYKIPEGIREIGYCAFGFYNRDYDDITGFSLQQGKRYACLNITNVIIPDSVNFLRDGCFAYCISLKSITIPEGVAKIGDCAFIGCSELSSISFPNSVIHIGRQAFHETPWYANQQEGECVYIGNVLYAYKGNMPNDTSIVIKDGIVSICESAFRGCTGLTSIAIPDSVKSIGEYAFSGCIGLTSIEIPNSVTSIEAGTFYGCKGLVSIAIPNSVTSIGGNFFGDGAFEGCTGLTSIEIPNSLTSIDNSTFEGCTGLTSIVVENDNTIYDSRNNCNAIIETSTNVLIRGCNTTIIPNSVTSIGWRAFKGCTSLTYITIPNSVTSIEGSAFKDCTSLISITLPKTITEIGEDIFSGCENLQTIRVPQGMTDTFCKMGLEPWRDKIVEPRMEEYTILLNIARGYEFGIGMARNLAQAALCYVQAADKGCAEAAYHLGELYEEGKALPQDYQQAADWFAKASQLYHPNGEARRQACLRMIEEENARLSAFQEEQRAARQAQLAQLAAAQKPQKTILFFDTETNGLPANYKLGVTATDNWPRLIQLGWIITDESGNILKRKSQLSYPQSFTIDADVTRLTGITTADAQRNGIALSDVLSEFMADVKSASLLVGHNVDFDMHIMGCELYRMGMNYRVLIDKPSVCTMVRSTDFCAIPSTSRYYSGYKFPSLTELYTKLFGHAFSGAHDALSDITATKDCYFELLRRGIV